MQRILSFCLLLTTCAAALNCQSYTTGVQQGSGRADEGAALANMRAITRAQAAYSITTSNDYGTFEQLAAGGYLDRRFNLSKPKFYGYVFTMQVSPKSGASGGSYSLNADPDPALKAAGRHFYTDSDSSEIYVNATKPASASDEKLKP